MYVDNDLRNRKKTSVAEAQGGRREVEGKAVRDMGRAYLAGPWRPLYRV